MGKKLRRNILKGVAAGVPVAWSKPVVNSLVLPAHASTSVTFSCGPFTFCNPDEEGEDAVYLMSDGVRCWFDQFNCCATEALPETNGNRIVMVDRDNESDVDHWDANDGPTNPIPVGDSNWSVSPDPGDGNSPGEYLLEATREGGPLNNTNFNVVLNVSFDDEDCTTVTATMTA